MSYLLAFFSTIVVYLLLNVILSWCDIRSWFALKAPHHIHQREIPRIGGLTIVAVVSFHCVSSFVQVNEIVYNSFVALLPMFILGLLEDMDVSISALTRMIFSLISGLLLAFLTGYSIIRVDVPMIDAALALYAISLFLTTLAISTVMNGLNLLDGLNGLACFFTSSTLFALGLIANNHFDYVLQSSSFFAAAVFLGFLPFNFPRARAFLGDSGAYICGGVCAMFVIVLVARVESVSPFVALMLIIYPFYEAVRTFFRRINEGANPLLADNKHLHHLTYNVIKRRFRYPDEVANPLASLILCAVIFLKGVYSVIFSASTISLMAGVLVFVGIYEIAHRKFSYILLNPN